MSELYDNLLKATSNIDDITTEKYATVTKLNNNYCDVKEEDTGLEHTNVPIVNGANLSVGDKAIIGFLNNSIYDVVCYGALDKTVHDDSKQDLLISGQNIKTINHTSLLGSGNIDIQGGGSDVDIVTSWEPTPSDTKVPSEKLTKNTLDNKVDKSSTTGLLKNDGTVDTTSYSTFSGSYNDLSNKPSIPSSSSDLSDGSDLVKKSSTSGLLKNDGSVDTNSYLTSSSLSNYVQKSSTTGLLKNDGTVDTSAYITSSAISGKEDTSNKVSSWSSTTNDTHYPTEKLVKDSLDSKQATLVSGTNIKTINNTSLLGSGNIVIQGGGTGVDIATSWGNPTSDSKVPSEKLAKDTLDGKANVSHTHTKSEITDFPSIPSKTSDLNNDSGFITSSSLPTKVSDLQNDTGFITSSALPTKTSDLTNDGDGTNAFLTQHQSLANYVQKSSTSGLLKNDGSVDTTQYLSSLPSHNHDDRYYTESEMDTALNRYDLTLSDYNPKTGSTITVTCKVTNVLGSNVQNKTVELFLNGTSQGTATTNSEGVATWSITFGATRSALFRVENAYAYVNYNSWKLMETKESNKVRVYANENMVALSIQDSFTLTANGNKTIATISSQYAPTYSLTTNFHPTLHQTKVMIEANGNITVYNNSSKTSGNARIYVTYPLKARMP